MKPPTPKENQLYEMMNILNQQMFNAEAMKLKNLAKRLRKAVEQCDIEIIIEKSK